MKDNLPVKIIIADDDAFARRGLESVLLNFPFVQKISVAENGKQVIEILDKEFHHLLFMDLKMPLMNGFECMSYLHTNFRKVKVIAFTLHGTDDMLFEMYDRGAMGYILKTENEDRVRDAIEAVMAGNYFYSDGGKRIIDHMKTEELRKLWKRTDDTLSPPEKEVLIHICNEMSIKEIAELMNISDAKAKYHHSRLLFKTGVKNTAGLVKFALREGIYQDDGFMGIKKIFRRK